MEPLRTQKQGTFRAEDSRPARSKILCAEIKLGWKAMVAWGLALDEGHKHAA